MIRPSSCLPPFLEGIFNLSELARTTWDTSDYRIFPGGSDHKASAYNDLGSIPGSARSPGEGNGIPLQYSCLENPLDGGTWLGYSPWGCRESDTTERLHPLTMVPEPVDAVPLSLGSQYAVMEGAPLCRKMENEGPMLTDLVCLNIWLCNFLV